MTAATKRVRRNSRRTWDDGSGCEHRPLHPHAFGCLGWRAARDGAEYVIGRCKQCRTFADDEDAAEHVAGCKPCQFELRALDAALDAEADEDDDDDGYDSDYMPSFRDRDGWAAWANHHTRGRGYFVLHAVSTKGELLGWLKRVDPNGDYDGLTLADLWEQLGFYYANNVED